MSDFLQLRRMEFWMLIPMKHFKLYLSKCTPETSILKLTKSAGDQTVDHTQQASLCPHGSYTGRRKGRGAGPQVTESVTPRKLWKLRGPLPPLHLHKPILLVRSQQAYLRVCCFCVLTMAPPGSWKVSSTEHLPECVDPECGSERRSQSERRESVFKNQRRVRFAHPLTCVGKPNWCHRGKPDWVVLPTSH